MGHIFKRKIFDEPLVEEVQIEEEHFKKLELAYRKIKGSTNVLKEFEKLIQDMDQLISHARTLKNILKIGKATEEHTKSQKNLQTLIRSEAHELLERARKLQKNLIEEEEKNNQVLKHLNRSIRELDQILN